MKAWFILLIFLAIFAPFGVAFNPYSNSIAPQFMDKLSLAQAFFSFYGFLIALIGVGEYLRNSRKHIEPQMYLNNRMRELTLKAAHFPCHVDLDFQILNNGNISIEKTSVNYTILIQHNVHLHISSGIKNEAGKEVIPGHRSKYEYNEQFQALGGEAPVKVFPQRMRKLFVANLVFPQPGTYMLHYYFTTDEGFFPKNIILDHNNEPSRNLGKLVLHVK